MRPRALLLTALLLLPTLADASAPRASAARGGARRQAAGLSSYFKDYPGSAFVLYDLKRGRYLRHDAARRRVRSSPFSTFKIANSVIGLDSGVIADADFLIRWDEKKRPAFDRDTLPFSEWWRDQTLRTALGRSVVWYYRELATRVGRRRMTDYVRRLRYGNADATGPLDGFWLDSTLKASADEQVEFLRRFYAEELPVSKRSVSIVKEILALEETPDYRLSGKTGGGPLGRNRFLGWFVGYVETRGGVRLFAARIEGPAYASIRDERIALTRRVLAGLGYIRP